MAVAAPVAVFVMLPRGQLAGAAGVLLGVAVLDVVAGVALHFYLRARGRVLSLAAAALRVLYAVLLVVALRHLIVGARSVADYRHEWNVGLGVFGLHLVALGVLLVRREGWARAVGALVTISGLGYLIDAGATLATGHPVGAAGVTFVGELVLMVWLLWRGVRGEPRRT